MARVLTEEELWDICRTAAMTVVAKYGIKDVGKFVKALMAVAMAESSGDVESVHDNGQGFGLFAEHNQGYANYLSKEQRLDPQQNANAAAMQLGRLWKDTDPFETNVQRMTGPEGQNPADPVALARNALTAAGQFARSVWPSAGGEAAGTEVGQASKLSLGEYLEQAGYVKATEDWQDEEGNWHSGAGYMGQDFYNSQPSDIKSQLWAEWKGEGTTAGLSPEEAAESRARTRKYGAETTQIEQEIEAYPGAVSREEREQKRKEIETEIAQGTLDWNQAVDKFNAWLNSTQEARLRAEKEFDVAEKRAAWTTPGEYYPGTEPGGVNAQMYERAGLPTYPSQKGIPVEQLPNLEETYGKWQQNLGVSQNAPAMAGVSTGPTAAQAFIQDLLQKHAMRTGGGGIQFMGAGGNAPRVGAREFQGGLPTMAGGGWMARDEPFIAGEEGPEVIQPTDTGTAVTPIGAGVGLRRYAGGRKPFPRRPIATVAPAPVPTGRTQPYATELAAFMSDFERQYGRRPGATEVYNWWSTARNQPYTPTSTNPAYAQQAYTSWLTSRRAA
jgi:hypothetical protein